MNSQKTKSKNFFRLNGKAIGGVVLIPEDGRLRAYVAWEWEDQAAKQFFAIVKSDRVFEAHTITNQTIDHVANYGIDVTNHPKARKHFPNLF